MSQNRIHQITSIEFPAGYIESGETAVTAAIRELQEETGYVAEQIHILDQYYPALSIDASMITIIFAKGCVKTTEQNLGAEEYIKYQEFSEAEVAWLIDHKKILGGGTKLAFALIQLLLKKDNQK